MTRSRVTNEEVIAAYRETGSVWRAGKKIGLAGQTVHDRLRVLGHPLSNRRWLPEEQDELRTLIANGVPLAEVAHRLGRTYAGAATQASLLGYRSKPVRQKKLPRGAGFDKVSTERHLRALERGPMNVTQYARQQSVKIDLLVVAFQRHFPERWNTYLETHAPLPRKTCVYCEAEFLPANGKQEYCTRDCATQARADRQYFGGQRRTTIGLAEGVCQLCGRSDVKGLSSHHVLGKENDPGNEFLIALCAGCHQVVTLVAARKFVDDPRAWEALIHLAWFRRHGPDIAVNDIEKVLYVEVEIEESPAEEWDDHDAEAS